jgi:transcription antitermination factor NusG
MSIPDDADPEALISRLAGPLSPSAREAFRRAAEAALAGLSCPGPGAGYGAVELPNRRLQYGDRVKILAGPFRGHLAIYAGMSAHERAAVLLQILGGLRRVTLTQREVEAIIC